MQLVRTREGEFRLIPDGPSSEWLRAKGYHLIRAQVAVDPTDPEQLVRLLEGGDANEKTDQAMKAAAGRWRAGLAELAQHTPPITPAMAQADAMQRLADTLAAALERRERR